MKKQPSDLLTEEQFWNIIQVSDKGQNLEDELSKLSEKELLGYEYWWRYFHRKAYNQALWCVAYIVGGGCSDDAFHDFCSWLITRGESVYTKALKDPDSLCSEFDEMTDEEPFLEEADYYAAEIFEAKYDKDIADVVAEEIGVLDILQYPIKLGFEWQEDDEASMRKICPNVFEQWWEE